MISFKNRMCMAKLFMEWAREYHAAPYPESVLAWLQTHDLLNEAKVQMFLSEHPITPSVPITFVDERYSTPKAVTATELAELHSRLFDSDGFSCALDSAWQRNCLGIFEIKGSGKPEYHMADPHRDAMDHWVYVLRNGLCMGNPHDSEKDAGLEAASNDTTEEETII